MGVGEVGVDQYGQSRNGVGGSQCKHVSFLKGCKDSDCVRPLYKFGFYSNAVGSHWGVVNRR